MTIIAKKLKKDEKVIQTIDDKDKKVFVEENEDKGYLEKEKKKLEKFLYSDSSTLQKESTEYNAVISDRMIQKVGKKAHKLTEKMKNKAIKLVLNDVTVLSFFNRIGIAINLEVNKKAQSFLQEGQSYGTKVKANSNEIKPNRATKANAPGGK